MMDISTINFWGKTKYWWVVVILGLLLIPCGFWLWFQPVIGYAVISTLLGWGLVLAGVVQLLVAGNVKRKATGWGWWLAGGIIDIFIGFVLIGNLSLSETILPFFFAFVFLYKGLSNLFSAFGMISSYKYWWLYLINGILLLVIAFLFMYSPFTAAYSIVFLCAIVFVYWGFSLILFAYDLRPRVGDGTDNSQRTGSDLL